MPSRAAYSGVTMEPHTSAPAPHSSGSRPRPVQIALGAVAHAYFDAMSGEHGARPGHAAPPADKWERMARASAARYRGMGMLVALNSALILLFALLPTVLKLEAGAVAVKVMKLLAMAGVILLLLAMARANRWRQTWISARRRAQRNASAPLRLAARELAAQPGDAERAAALRRHCEGTLAGQVAYNRATAHCYHAIEHRTEFITYTAFALSFVAACADALMTAFFGSTAKWPLLLTAFLPGVVGLVHGLNGFLGVGEQAFSCSLMARRLGELRERVATDGAAPAVLLQVARETLRLLEGHDQVWAPSVGLPSV